MRVALVTSSYSPYAGGVETHVQAVAQELAQRGHSVQVWTVQRDGKHIVRELDGITVVELPTPLPARTLPSILSWVARAPSAALAWSRAHRRFQPQMLHVHCFGPNGTYGWALSMLMRTPLVLSSHGETMADQDRLFETSALAKWSMRKAIGRASSVTGCSEVVLDDLRDRFGLAPTAGSVVPNGVEPLPEDSTRRNDGALVVAVGRLVEVKGFDLLMKAFARADLPGDTRLVIGGDGPCFAELERLSRKLGIDDRLDLPGRLSAESVRQLMASARVVVVPSRFEAFGITALEAWRSGAPVIATTRGGLREFISDGDDGMLIDPEKTDDLAVALAVLVNDPRRARKMGEAGKRRVREFTWAAVVDGYEREYAKLDLT